MLLRLQRGDRDQQVSQGGKRERGPAPPSPPCPGPRADAPQGGQHSEVLVDLQHGGVQQRVDVAQALQPGLQVLPLVAFQSPQLLRSQPGEASGGHGHGGEGCREAEAQPGWWDCLGSGAGTLYPPDRPQGWLRLPKGGGSGMPIQGGGKGKPGAGPASGPEAEPGAEAEAAAVAAVVVAAPLGRERAGAE